MNLRRLFFIAVAIISFSLFSTNILIMTRNNALLRSLLPKRSSNILCPNCNVLLVSLDTCSAQHMPCYGYGRQTTPNFCLFSKENIFFSNSFANSTRTLPSRVSLFTGLLPSHHGIVASWLGYLPNSIPLLSDELHKHGYETLFHTPADDPAVSPQRVFKRGMSELIRAGYDSDTYIDKALETLQQNSHEGKKTFLTFHTYTCHEPYYATDDKLYINGNFSKVQKQFGKVPNIFSEEFYKYLLEQLPIAISERDYNDETPVVNQFYNYLKSASDYHDALSKLPNAKRLLGIYGDYILNDNYWNYYFYNAIDAHDKQQMEYLTDLYDQRLHELDANVISKIRSAMMHTPLKDNTIVIITSEHGQEFGEHGTFGHGRLYDLNIKVPLMIRIPRTKPMTISDNVEGVDIMPTVLEHLVFQMIYYLMALA